MTEIIWIGICIAFIVIFTIEKENREMFFGKNRIDYRLEKRYILAAVVGYYFAAEFGSCMYCFFPASLENLYNVYVEKILFFLGGPFSSITFSADEYLTFTAILILVILSPILEEMLFRGAFFLKLREHANFLITMIITSFVFAMTHPAFLNFLYAFSTGCALAVIMEKYRDIRLPIILHMCNNLAASLGLGYEIADGMKPWLTPIFAIITVVTLFVFYKHVPKYKCKKEDL